MISKLQNINFTNYTINQTYINKRDNSVSKSTLSSIPFTSNKVVFDEPLKNSLFKLIGKINKMEDIGGARLTSVTSGYGKTEYTVHRNCKNKGAILLDVDDRKNRQTILLSGNYGDITDGESINLDKFVETLKQDNPDLSIETMVDVIKTYFGDSFLNFTRRYVYNDPTYAKHLDKYHQIPN